MLVFREILQTCQMNDPFYFNAFQYSALTVSIRQLEKRKLNFFKLSLNNRVKKLINIRHSITEFLREKYSLWMMSIFQESFGVFLKSKTAEREHSLPNSSPNADFVYICAFFPIITQIIFQGWCGTFLTLGTCLSQNRIKNFTQVQSETVGPQLSPVS